MTLLAPSMLWSLVVLLPLVAIYFLKVRPRRKPTTAYFLWEQIFQEKRSSSLFQSLRDVWSLVLMILAAVAISLALARPEFSDERRDLLIVIDQSASMGAEDGRTTRLELAKDAARDIIHGLNGSQRASVATLGRELSYLSHLTDNPRELLEAVDRIVPTGDNLDLAAAPGGGKDELWTRAHRILLISDGAFDADRLPPQVELFQVGRRQVNLGLVAADLSLWGGSTSRLGFYFQLVSTYDQPQQAELTLTHVDAQGRRQLFKLIPLEVKPGVNPPETFTLEGAPVGRWLAQLEVDDGFAADNVAHLAVAAPDPVKVAIASTERYFLENSVLAFSQQAGLLTLVGNDEKEATADVVLAKSTTPDSRFTIIFQPQGEAAWWTELGDEIIPGAARVLVEDHPVLRHVDATTIPFIGARQITPAAGSQVLVADDRGAPLIFLTRKQDRAAVVVNLDPAAADFYFSAWFPILVHSAATHLAARENPPAATYRPGEAVPIPGGREHVVTMVTPPPDPAPMATGEAQNLEMEVQGAWFGGIDQLGFYSLANPTGRYDVGASLLSERESLINNESAADRHEPISRGRPPAHWLTLLAIVILTGESVLYHRRKVG
jgi:hypothetical protein